MRGGMARRCSDSRPKCSANTTNVRPASDVFLSNAPMRRIILKLHLVAALAAGAFLAVLGVTGAIMAFEPELDHLLHRPLWHVTPQGAPRTLAELGDAASKTQD